MSDAKMHRLRQPCKNRGLELINNGDGSATINNHRFISLSEAENYLMNIPRKDI